MFQPFLLVAVLSVSLSPSLVTSDSRLLLSRQQQFPAALLQQTKEPELLTQGREAYRKGEFENALISLKQAAEAVSAPEHRAMALYYLGRSYYSLDRYAEARASYLRLLSENPAFVLARYELGKVCLAQDDFAQAAEQYANLKQIGQILQAEAKQRAETAAKDPAAQPRMEADAILLVATAKAAQSQADELAIYLGDLFPAEEAARYQIKVPPVYPGAPTKENPILKPLDQMGKEGVGRPTILSREKARYTEPARYNCVQGTVVLSVVFSAEGELKDIRVVRGLPDGLIRKAIEAALKIRFQPATKDGIPVSVRGNLEYSFNLY
jgi:TonB family protein